MCQLVANNSNRTGFHLCVSDCWYIRSCASAGARWGRRKSLMHFLLTITCYTQQNHREIVKGQSFLCVERIRVSKRKKQYALKYIYTIRIHSFSCLPCPTSAVLVFSFSARTAPANKWKNNISSTFTGQLHRCKTIMLCLSDEHVSRSARAFYSRSFVDTIVRKRAKAGVQSLSSKFFA